MSEEFMVFWIVLMASGFLIIEFWPIWKGVVNRVRALLSTRREEGSMCNRERNPDNYPADIDDAKGF